jgi:hypothetical protein
MLAVKGRLNLLTGQLAVAQRELAQSAELAGDADPLLAVELLDLAGEAALEAGLPDEATGGPSAWPIWPNDPVRRADSWPIWLVVAWPGGKVIRSAACT